MSIKSIRKPSICLNFQQEQNKENKNNININIEDQNIKRKGGMKKESQRLFSQKRI